MGKYKVDAVNFIGTMMANVDNEKLSDKDFRDFIRNTLPIVEKPEHYMLANKEVAANVAKYYPIEEVDVASRLESVKVELDKYFKGTYIKSYVIDEIIGSSVYLRPTSPDFDEDYYDDKMDKAIANLGE